MSLPSENTTNTQHILAERPPTRVLRAGIKNLDDHLPSGCPPGILIGVGAPTGAGKTILATQSMLAGLKAGQIVHLISTEAKLPEYYMRLFSQITEWDYTHLRNNHQAAFMEHPKVLEKILKWKADDFLRFDHVKIENLHETLNKVFEGPPPNQLIVDYVDTYTQLFDSQKIREHMEESTRILRKIADEFHMSVMAIYQANSSQPSIITHDDLDERPKVRELMNAFIGIGQAHVRKSESLDGNVYSYRQILQVDNSWGKESVELATNFQFQKFSSIESLLEPDAAGYAAEFFRNQNSYSAFIRASSDHRGWVPFTRERFQEVVEASGKTYAVNVYAFICLVANNKGTMYWSLDKIGDELGLSRPQVRTAIERLKQAELICDTGNRRSRAIVYGVSEWDRHHRVATATTIEEGYFPLFKNLRDDSRSSLRKNPKQLKLWLYLLSRAQGKTIRENCITERQRATIKPEWRKMEIDLGISKDTFLIIIDELISEDRLRYSTCDISGRQLIVITNWDAYHSLMQKPANQTHSGVMQNSGEIWVN